MARKNRSDLMSLLLTAAVVGAVLAGCSDSPPASLAADSSAKPAAAESAPATGPQEPWTEAQLIEPAALAKILTDPTAKKPYVLDIGTPSLVRGGRIKDSIVIGPAYEPKNVEKLRATVSTYPKDADVVIYCGCCPFKDCPNIRPAFRVLQEMKLTRPKLLHIRQTLKTDWISKGYPSET